MKIVKKIIFITTIVIFFISTGYITYLTKTNELKELLNEIEIYKEISHLEDIVEDITIKEIKLDNPTTDMIVGKNQQLTVIINNESKVDNAKLIWTSSNYKVAKVDKHGYLTATGYGKTVITVTASNGKSDFFELNVTYKNPIFKLTSGILDTQKSIIKKINSNTTASSLYKSIENNENLSIYDKDGELMCNNTYLTTHLIETGSYIEYFNSEGKKVKLYLSVNADLNGDGEVDIQDLKSMMNHISGKETLTGAYLESAYLNNDKKIDSLDLAYIMNKIAGKKGY